MLRKVFGIISYFPDNDSEYHKYVRKQRTKRCSELLLQLDSLWPNIDIIIVAQNWQDYQPPKIHNRIRIIPIYYDKLGITGARKELRTHFLTSNYDYLIMLDDDAVIHCNDPRAYIQEIEEHPSGIGVISHKEDALVLAAISKSIYNQIDMPNLDAEQGQGFEGSVFVANCFSRFPDLAFDFTTDIKNVSDATFPSTWSNKSIYEHNHMLFVTDALVSAAKHQAYVSDDTSTPCIDAVIPYVDCADPNWVDSYTVAMDNDDFSKIRFRSWGTLKYLLRGIAKYMPFIRNVLLIVSDKSQVPDWVSPHLLLKSTREVMLGSQGSTARLYMWS